MTRYELVVFFDAADDEIAKRVELAAACAVFDSEPAGRMETKLSECNTDRVLIRRGV